jgi:hypothetical protein
MISGAAVGGIGSGGWNSRDPIRQVTLILDGVFFLDGEFVGPNAEKLFEQTVAGIALEGHNKGLRPGEILAEIQRATGPAPERHPMNVAFRDSTASQEEFRRAALQTVAFQLAMRRGFPQAPDEEQAVLMAMAWNHTVLPHFRKGD